MLPGVEPWGRSWSPGSMVVVVVPWLPEPSSVVEVVVSTGTVVAVCPLTWVTTGLGTSTTLRAPVVTDVPGEPIVEGGGIVVETEVTAGNRTEAGSDGGVPEIVVSANPTTRPEITMAVRTSDHNGARPGFGWRGCEAAIVLSCRRSSAPRTTRIRRTGYQSSRETQSNDHSRSDGVEASKAECV